jgi:hypothetical protein
MKLLLPRACLIAGVTTLLASCGGGNMDPVAMPQKQAASVQQSAPLPAASYFEVVQELYISYFGRPADTGGLTNFANRLSQLQAPSEIQGVNAAYATNPSLRELIDSFGTSAESAALYSGDNDAFVTAIYANVLNRAPDAEGKAFWVNAINKGELTRPDASLSIMAGALLNSTPQGLLDGKLVRNRIIVAGNFTGALDTPAKQAAYAGDAAAATVRAMLRKVDANTDIPAFNVEIENTINALLAAAGPSFATVQGIINRRCIVCHSGAFAPLGIRLDTEAGIRNNAANIYTQVWVTRAMPQGNSTGMTEDERNTIRLWFEAGAK